MITRKISIRLASLLGSIALTAAVMASSPAAADDNWYAPGGTPCTQPQYQPYCDEGPTYGLYPPGFYPYYGDWNYDFRSHDFDHRNNSDHHGGNVGHGGGGHR